MTRLRFNVFILQGDSSSKGTVEGIELVLHGTQEKPWVLEKVGCREYDQEAIKDAQVSKRNVFQTPDH